MEAPGLGEVVAPREPLIAAAMRSQCQQQSEIPSDYQIWGVVRKSEQPATEPQGLSPFALGNPQESITGRICCHLGAGLDRESRIGVFAPVVQSKPATSI